MHNHNVIEPLLRQECTKYAYGQECKYGETCKFIHKRICKIYVKYGQCRFGQRCNYSHDLEGRCMREEEHGWCQYGKKCFYGHFRQYETEYASPERGSQVEGRNRQGYQQRYQQGGPVYNIDYDRKPQHMIDNQLRQDTQINVDMNRELKEEIIREVEEIITFLKCRA